MVTEHSLSLKILQKIGVAVSVYHINEEQNTHIRL